MSILMPKVIRDDEVLGEEICQLIKQSRTNIDFLDHLNDISRCHHARVNYRGERPLTIIECNNGLGIKDHHSTDHQINIR